MAFFRNVVLLCIGFLLTESLVECFEGDITTLGYDCASGNVCSCQDESCSTVECRNIDTEEEVKCARKILRELRAIANFTVLTFHKCKLKSIPGDFLKSHPLERINCSECVSAKIPRDLMAPVCGTLRSLLLKFRDQLKTIGEKAFGECPVLKYLILKLNHIDNVSPKAFLGLSNLDTLDLSFNDIATIEGLEGIPRLKTLILRNNRLKYLAKNAFKNLRSLEYINLQNNEFTILEKGTFHSLTNLIVHLSDNPLNCDCSLKWLHEWSKTRDEYSRAKCGQERKKIPLKDVDLSHCPPGKSSRNSVTDITVFLSLLTLALKYFEVL